MTVAWSRRLAAGAASTALSTSACDAPGSNDGGAGAPRPSRACADALVEIPRTTRMNRAMRFIPDLQLTSATFYGSRATGSHFTVGQCDPTRFHTLVVAR